MKLSIIGCGYVGLVTGACLAEKGHDVTCVDIDRERIAQLNSGCSPIHEAGLEELLRRHAGERLRATADLAAAVQATEVTFIAVGTPFNGRTIDLDAVLRVTREIGAALRAKDDYHLVVVKSTVVPGTTDTLVLAELEAASNKLAGEHFGLGVNPEFLSEGRAVQDFLHPDRIVLGGIDGRSLARLAEVYAPFPDTPRIETGMRTAEMIKYASNALLATLVSFSNEITAIGAALHDIDPLAVMRGIHLSQYFRHRGPDDLPALTTFLHPGCGFGGSCLPKDVKALIAHAQIAGESAPLLRAVIAVNDRQPLRIIELLERRWPYLHGVRITILGLAFKPGTDDVRETPARPLIQRLLERDANVAAYDPVATPAFRRLCPDPRIAYRDTLADALADADAVIVVTPWPEFSDLDRLLVHRAPAPLIVDSRRALSPPKFAAYVGIGD